MARSKLKKVFLIGFAGLVLALAAAFFLGLPEAIAGRFLSGLLGTEVRVEDVDFHSLSSLTLKGVEAGPVEAGAAEGGPLEGIRAVSVNSVKVQASLLAALGGEVDSVAVDGARVELVPPAPWLREQEGGGSFLLHHLEVRNGEILILGPEEGAATPEPFRLTATLDEIGAETTGEVRLTTEHQDLGPLLAYAGQDRWGLHGRVEQVQVTARLETLGAVEARVEAAGLDLARGEAASARLRGLHLDLRQRQGGPVAYELQAPRAAVAASGEELELSEVGAAGTWGDDVIALFLEAAGAELVSAGGRQALPAPRFDASASKAGESTWQLTLEPRMAFLGEGKVEGLWKAGASAPHQLEGSLSGIRLGLLAPWLPLPEGLEVEGIGELDLSTKEERLHLDARLDVRRLLLPSDDGPWTLTGTSGTVAAVVNPADPWRQVEVDVSLSAADSQGGSLPSALFPARAGLEGTMDLRPGLVADGRWTFVPAVAGRMEARGGLTLADPPLPQGELTWTWRGAEAPEVAGLLASLGRPLPEGLAAAGRVRGEGTVVLEAGSLARLGGRLSLEGARFEATEPVEWQLAEAAAGGRFTYRPRDSTVRLADLSLAGTATVPPLAPAPLQGSGEATVRLGSGGAPTVVEIGALEIAGSELGTLEAAGRLTASEDGLTGALDLAAEGSQVRAWRDLLRPLTGELASGLAIDGQGEAQLALQLEEGGHWRLEGPGTISGSGFSSEDGSRVLDGLDSRWQLSLRGGPGGPQARLQADAQVEGFQLLWGSFFGDFSSLESSLSLAGEISAAPVEGGFPGWELETAWQVSEGPAFTGRLERDPAAGLPGTPPPDLRYEATLDLRDLDQSYDRYLRTPLADALPQLERIQLSGDVIARLEGAFRGEGGTTLEGRLTTSDLTIEGIEGQAAVRELDLNLPTALAWSADGELIAGEERQGSVGFQRAEVRGLHLPAVASTLTVLGDRVRVAEPVSLNLAGGQVILEDLLLAEVLDPRRFVEMGLRLEGLQLERLARALQLPPLDGVAEGSLPRVRLTATTLQVDGGGAVSVFGGTVRVGSISGENVLSRFPKVTFSADLEGIDLGRVTRRFDVGDMQGILQGSISDCTLFRGTPVTCSARFETVKRRGVKRTIGVKAVNNIAILGTGASASFLDRGIHKLFDKYTYKRLGIQMVLENDVFLLRGLESRGDKELFLKGRLPFPIDVVNAQPGRTVSFQTMLRRLKNLNFSNTRVETSSALERSAPADRETARLIADRRRTPEERPP